MPIPHFDPRCYPVAYRINVSGLYIGCHQDLDDEAFDHLEQTMRQFFKVYYKYL